MIVVAGFIPASHGQNIGKIAQFGIKLRNNYRQPTTNN
jgi:hypothetical protein